jgi:hypothetical protein
MACSRPAMTAKVRVDGRGDPRIKVRVGRRRSYARAGRPWFFYERVASRIVAKIRKTDNLFHEI